MRLNDLPAITRKTWTIPATGKKYKPKDIEMLYIATCLGGESGELLNKIKKVFRYKYFTKAHSEKDLAKKVKEEMTDVLYYVSRLADLLDVNMEKELESRMKENVKRYGMTQK
jgi:NTP pyrophosphatase (non-canonical NTP hydrolase)